MPHFRRRIQFAPSVGQFLRVPMKVVNKTVDQYPVTIDIQSSCRKVSFVLGSTSSPVGGFADNPKIAIELFPPLFSRELIVKCL